MPEAAGKLFSLEEVAEILGVPLEQVRSWAELRTLSSFETPTGRRVRRVELERFAEPLVEPEVLDAAVRNPFEQHDQATVMEAAASGLARAFAERQFDLESRVRPLFHYTSASTALDHVLTEGRLRLAPPSGMNDPFESDPYHVNLRGDWVGEPDAIPEVFTTASRELRDRCRLACLTRSGPHSWTSLMGFGNGYMRARMWAQYADGHAGVCLAFDNDALKRSVGPLERAGVRAYQAPVRYRGEEEREVLIELPIERACSDLPGLIDDLFPSVVAGVYFSKAWDWSSESEYRVLLRGDVEDYEYLDVREALTGVFCGPRFPEATLRDLRVRCRELWDSGRVYRMFWRNGMAVALPAEPSRSTEVSWAVPKPPWETLE